jgi:hypothetical protein
MNNRLLKINADGIVEAETGNANSTLPGQFDIPHNIVMDDMQRLWVADRANKRIQVLSSSGSNAAMKFIFGLQIFDDSLALLAVWTCSTSSSLPSSSTPSSLPLPHLSPYGLSFVRNHPSLPLPSAVIVSFTNDDSSTGSQARALHPAAVLTLV